MAGEGQQAVVRGEEGQQGGLESLHRRRWGVVLCVLPPASFQRLLAKLQSWERLDQTTGLSIR